MIYLTKPIGQGVTKTDPTDLYNQVETEIQARLDDKELSKPTFDLTDSTGYDKIDVDNKPAETQATVEVNLRNREGKIDHKFERLSAEISEQEFDAAEYNRVSLQLSQQDQEDAAQDFDQLIQDIFLDDKSEDWLSNDSSPARDIDPVALVPSVHQGENMHWYLCSIIHTV